MFSTRALFILAPIAGMLVAGVFMVCRLEGKNGKESVMETLGWGIGLAIYSVADYLMMAVSLG